MSDFVKGFPALIDRLEVTRSELDRSDEQQCPIRLSNAGACARAMAFAIHRARHDNWVREFPPKTCRTLITGTDAGIRNASLFVDTMYSCAASVGFSDARAEGTVSLRLDDNLSAQERTEAVRLMHQIYLKEEEPASWLPLWVDHGSLYVTGHTDLTFVDDAGDLWVVDFKIKGSYGYRQLAKEGPDHTYVAQVQAYMAAIDEGEDLVYSGNVKGMLVYENRDTSDVCAFEVPAPDNFQIGNIQDKFVTVIKSMLADDPHPVAMGHIPELKTTKAIGEHWALPWSCNYCPHWMKCLANRTWINHNKTEIPANLELKDVPF